MQNKKNYNNLPESIVMTIFLIIVTCFYFIMMYFGVLHPKEGTNPIATLVVGTIVFGGISTLSIIVIIIWCYEYWYIDGKSIFSKKIFRKKKVILISQIERVEKKVVSALIFGTYRSEAYIIYSGKIKITILISSEKKYKDLDDELRNYIIN